jgi:hypothetical protein
MESVVSDVGGAGFPGWMADWFLLTGPSGVGPCCAPCWLHLRVTIVGMPVSTSGITENYGGRLTMRQGRGSSKVSVSSFKTASIWNLTRRRVRAPGLQIWIQGLGGRPRAPTRRPGF